MPAVIYRLLQTQVFKVWKDVGCIKGIEFPGSKDVLFLMQLVRVIVNQHSA